MNKVAQVFIYGVFAIGIGYFSVMPEYHYANPESAVIKLSFSHAGHRLEECVKLTPDEINARARSGESLNECERERLPVTVELDIDGETVLHISAAPSGFWNDGPASVYERIDVAAGTHVLAARLRDSARESGWDYEHTETVELRPGRYFTVRFRAESGGFAFR